MVEQSFREWCLVNGFKPPETERKELVAPSMNYKSLSQVYGDLFGSGAVVREVESVKKRILKKVKICKLCPKTDSCRFASESKINCKLKAWKEYEKKGEK
jgi:hypothetical protein